MGTDEYVAYRDEGEADPEYPRTSAVDRWRKLLTAGIGGLLALVLIVTFFAAICGLAQHLGGPTE